LAVVTPSSFGLNFPLLPPDITEFTKAAPMERCAAELVLLPNSLGAAPMVQLALMDAQI